MTARVIPLRPRTDQPVRSSRDRPPGGGAGQPRRRSPSRRRTWTHVFTGAAVAAVLAATAAVLTHGGESHGDGSAGSPSAAHAAPPSPGALEEAAGVSWTEVQGVHVPSSPTAGPMLQDGALATGFADSDLGAALAAIHIVYRASPAPGPAVFREALERQVVGPGKAPLMQAVEADYEHSRFASGLPAGSPLGKGSATFTGYTVTAMPGGDRHVQVTEQAPDSNGVQQTFSLDVVVTRVDGDWRVIAPSRGTWVQAITRIDAVPAGLTPFSPAAPGDS